MVAPLARKTETVNSVLPVLTQQQFELHSVEFHRLYFPNSLCIQQTVTSLSLNCSQLEQTAQAFALLLVAQLDQKIIRNKKKVYVQNRK